MRLAEARAQMGGESPEWKCISNFGIAGAVAELRRKVNQAEEEGLPSQHVEELAGVLVRAIRAYATAAPDLTRADALSALRAVGKAVRGHGLIGAPS
jgi:hypothetical protein